MNDIRWLNDHFVDLVKTPWDKEKSHPEKGEFVFTGPKVYYRRGHDSPWKVGFFIRYSPPYRELTMMEATYGITPIKAVDALVYPEGLRPNVEGYYQFDDVILAKEPKMSFLKRRKDAVEETDRRQKTEMNKFVQEGAELGSKVGFYDL